MRAWGARCVRMTACIVPRCARIGLYSIRFTRRRSISRCASSSSPTIVRADGVATKGFMLSEWVAVTSGTRATETCYGGALISAVIASSKRRASVEPKVSPLAHFVQSEVWGEGPQLCLTAKSLQLIPTQFKGVGRRVDIAGVRRPREHAPSELLLHLGCLVSMEDSPRCSWHWAASPHQINRMRRDRVSPALIESRLPFCDRTVRLVFASLSLLISPGASPPSHSLLPTKSLSFTTK